VIDVLLPLKTVAGLNAREHWRARSARVKRERQTARLVLASSEPTLPCIVTMIRMSSGVLDDDNLQGACKAIRDGVADWLGLDDRDPRVTWRYAQEKCRRGDFGVRVWVKERNAA
jgi:hypothetical protein